MELTKTDKIIIAGTAIVVVTAAINYSVAKKYETAALGVQEELRDIEYLLSKNREDILIGNKEIVEGNRLLRSLVKKSAEEISGIRISTKK